MNSLRTPKPLCASPDSAPSRYWRAHLRLRVAYRPEKSVLEAIEHEGPLRVQRPFYPEADGCCHVYILHPPGGLVVGDELDIQARVTAKAQALLTTPSAGKIYGAKHKDAKQQQNVQLSVEDGACLEWLPQETIIFDNAQAHLKTKIDISGRGKFFGWDIIRLGRAASGELFSAGACFQSIEIWKNGKPLFIEKNKIIGGEEVQAARWGLRNKNTTATLVASMVLDRHTIDTLYIALEKYTAQDDYWGLTQKENIFIARYLGNSISDCRKGFELIWRETREIFNGKKAVVPRIWNT